MRAPYSHRARAKIPTIWGYIRRIRTFSRTTRFRLYILKWIGFSCYIVTRPLTFPALIDDKESWRTLRNQLFTYQISAKTIVKYVIAPYILNWGIDVSDVLEYPIVHFTALLARAIKIDYKVYSVMKLVISKFRWQCQLILTFYMLLAWFSQGRKASSTAAVTQMVSVERANDNLDNKGKTQQSTGEIKIIRIGANIFRKLKADQNAESRPNRICLRCHGPNH